MKLIGQVVAVVFSLALIAALGFGAWLTFRGIGALFAGLDPQVATVTGIACLIALLAAWMIARSIGAASRQSKASAIREEKAATYQLFVDFWGNRLRQGPADLSEKPQVLERVLALYGGTAVIKAHTALRRLAHENGVQHPDVRAGLARALAAIREDLGSDTPHDIASELERLVAPEVAVGGTPQPKGAPPGTTFALTSP
jgi:hypothetical protein